jgi:hypothetical protein
MSAPGAMHGEMPGNPPGRPGGEHDEPLLDMIFERRPLPPGAPREVHDLARVLAAAAGPAEPGELAGEAVALAAFTRLISRPGTSPAARRSARRWLSGRPPRGKLPLAAALVVAAIGLGSTAVAYAGALPGPIQHFAHTTMGAPDSRGSGPQHKHAAALPRPSTGHLLPSHSATPAPRPANSAPSHRDVSSPVLRRPSSRRSVRPARAACTPRPVSTHGGPKPKPTQRTPGYGPPAWPIPSPAKQACGAPAAAAVVGAADPHPAL